MEDPNGSFPMRDICSSAAKRIICKWDPRGSSLEASLRDHFYGGPWRIFAKVDPRGSVSWRILKDLFFIEDVFLFKTEDLQSFCANSGGVTLQKKNHIPDLDDVPSKMIFPCWFYLRHTDKHRHHGKSCLSQRRSSGPAVRLEPARARWRSLHGALVQETISNPNLHVSMNTRCRQRHEIAFLGLRA